MVFQAVGLLLVLRRLLGWVALGHLPTQLVTAIAEGKARQDAAQR